MAGVGKPLAQHRELAALPNARAESLKKLNLLPGQFDLTAYVAMVTCPSIFRF